MCGRLFKFTRHLTEHESTCYGKTRAKLVRANSNSRPICSEAKGDTEVWTCGKKPSYRLGAKLCRRLRPPIRLLLRWRHSVRRQRGPEASPTSRTNFANSSSVLERFSSKMAASEFLLKKPEETWTKTELIKFLKCFPCSWKHKN